MLFSRETAHVCDALGSGPTGAGFDEQRWAEHRFEVVVAGNMAKFGQWQLRDLLADTGSRVLIEASSRNMVWGIELADDERAGSPERWPGLNLLGLALMEVRHQLCGEWAA